MPAARESPHPLGVVYTPPDVARAMTRLALSPLVEGASARDILALRICDPAAGTGAFLVEVVAYLADHLVLAWQREGREPLPTWAHDARRLVATTCIAGVDIDRGALRIAARHLASADLASADLAGADLASADLASDAVATDTSADLAAIDSVGLDAFHLHVGDALSFDWRATFSTVFANEGFDVVLANPPYVRQESLGSKAHLEDFEVYDGVADLYVYFVELAHRLLRPRGRFCVILPNKWMTVEYGRPLRTFLATARSVDGVIDLSSHALFADADAFPCIVWGTIGASEHREVIAMRARTNRSVEDELVHAATPPTTPDLATSRELATPIDRDDSSFTTHPRGRWTSDPWHIDSSSDLFLLDRFALAYPTLGDVIGMRWSRGVVTGLNDAFVIDRATRDALLASDLACAAWIRPFIKGRDIRPYTPTAIERFLLLVDRGTAFDLLPAPIREHLERFRDRLEPKPIDHVGAWPGRKPGSYAWYELQDPVVPLAKSHEPRLFYQDIQTTSACSFDPAGELVPDTTVWILPSRDRYLLAILNSRLYRWYAQRRFPPALNGAVRPKLAYMQRLPIPVPSRSLRLEIEAHVDRRLAIPIDATGDLAREREVLEHQIERYVEHAYELSSLERALVAS